jgi:hypothetical protein
MTLDDEYKLFLKQTNELTSRRQSVTTAYLSVNAAIVGALAFLFKDGYMPDWPQQASALVLFLAGVVACDLWRRLILQYSTLLKWWYRHLRGLEDRLPKSSSLISKEYQDLYVEQTGKVRVGLTRYEIGLTWLFTGVYVVFFFSILMAWFLV